MKSRYNTFASAGSDGTVSIWDHKSKKRLRQYSKYSDAVNSIAFNSDGTRLAIGVSYNWDEGAAGARAFGERNPKVWIRDIGDEVKVGSLSLDIKIKKADLYFSRRVGRGSFSCRYFSSLDRVICTI